MARIARVSQRFETIYLDVPDCNQRIAEFTDREEPDGNSDEISVYLENTLESDTYFSGDKIQKELQRAILTLSERQRLIFNMKYFDDMPYEDMADVLGVAVGTLKATYHNAVKKIEENLKIVDTLN